MRGGLFVFVSIFFVGTFLFGYLTDFAFGLDRTFMEFRLRSDSDIFGESGCRADVLFEDHMIVLMNKNCLPDTSFEKASEALEKNISKENTSDSIVKTLPTDTPILNIGDEKKESSLLDDVVIKSESSPEPKTQEIVIDHQSNLENINHQSESDKINQTEKVDLPNIKYGDVLINEIVSDPESSQKEWVELFNSSGRDINLDGWYLIEGSGLKMPLSGILAGLDLLVIDAKSLNNSGDLIRLYSNEKLLIHEIAYGNWNDGFISDNKPAPSKGISLARNSSGEDVLTTTQTKGTPNVIVEPLVVNFEKPIIKTIPEKINEEKNKNDEAVEVKVVDENFDVKLDESDLRSDSDVISVEPAFIGINPKSLLEDSLGEVMLVSTPLYGDIKISELYADPDGDESSEEFIELYNLSNRDLNLANCFLKDLSGKRFIFTQSDIVNAGSYLVIFRTRSGIVLNNTSDEVGFFCDEDILIDVLGYSDAIEGWSYQLLISGGDEWMAHPSPGRSTVADDFTFADIRIASMTGDPDFEKKEDLLLVNSIEEVRKDNELGELVVVEGVVTVEPGMFEKGVMYIMDQSGGIEVTIPSSFEKNSYLIGDLVQIQGILSLRYGELRIKVSKSSDIRLIKKQAGIKPIEMVLSEMDSSREGAIVSVRGRIVDQKNQILYLSSDNGEVMVWMKHLSQKNSFKNGDEISVTGVVRLGRDSDYYIYPRSLSDIEASFVVSENSNQVSPVNEIFNSPSAIKITNKGFWIYFLYVGIVGVSIIGYLFYRKLQISKKT